LAAKAPTLLKAEPDSAEKTAETAKRSPTAAGIAARKEKPVPGKPETRAESEAREKPAPNSISFVEKFPCENSKKCGATGPVVVFILSPIADLTWV